MGIRCESGAIPVAVNPLPAKAASDQSKPLFADGEWEGGQKAESQKTCRYNIFHQMLSGERQDRIFYDDSICLLLRAFKNFFMKKIMLFACACLAMQVLRAQDSTMTLDEIIISASKTPIKQSQTGKVVSVITSKMIEDRAGQTLSQLLNSVAGLTINGAENNPGTSPTVFMRGASGGNTLILVDGVPLYDASGISGEFDLNNFDIASLEKIEILKGAQSTLYGSDAVAGVINLITKKPASKLINANALLAAGSFGTFRGSATVSGTTGNGYTYIFSYAKLYSDGFSSAYDSTGKAGFDNDGFSRDQVMLRIGLPAGKKNSLSLYGKYGSYKADIDAGAFKDDKDYTYHNDNTIAGLEWDHHLKNGRIKFQYYANWYNRNFTDDSADIGGFATYQHGRYNGFSHYGELYTNLKLSETTDLLTGADYRHNATDQIYEYLPYGLPGVPLSDDSAHTSQWSAYASLHYQHEKKFGIETGGRFNHHSIYGFNYTTSINPYAFLTKDIKVYATLSSGYRIPSLYQLYSEYGNKLLKPENTTSIESGMQLSKTKYSLRVTGFLRSGSNIIFFYTDPITYAGEYRNGDKQQDYGVETEVRFSPGKIFSGSLNYTFTDGRITRDQYGKDTSYFNLYKRPKHVLNVAIQAKIAGRLSTAIALHAASKSFEEQYMASPFVLKGYYRLDAHLQYRAARFISLFVNFENITDQKYFVTRGYNTNGFNILGGIRLDY